MNLSAALGFPFRGKNAWPNILLLMLCCMIPVVGPIVAMGYIILTEKILLQNIHADAPRFDFGNFGNYLQRGIYPFLAVLVLVLILYAVLIPVIIIFVFAFIFMQNSTAAIITLIILAVLTYIAILLVFMAIAQPMQFKSAMEGSFAAAFDRHYLFDYWKRVGWLTIGTQLLVAFLFIPLSLIACIPLVGMGAALAIMLPVQGHLNTQLYQTYLQRGGHPVTIKPEPEQLKAFEVGPSGQS